MCKNEKWILVGDEIPRIFAGKFTVKLQNNEEVKALFFSDAMSWITVYKMKSSHWWNADTHERLDNVIYWKKICNNEGVCTEGHL